MPMALLPGYRSDEVARQIVESGGGVKSAGNLGLAGIVTSVVGTLLAIAGDARAHERESSRSRGCAPGTRGRDARRGGTCGSGRWHRRAGRHGSWQRRRGRADLDRRRRRIGRLSRNWRWRRGVDNTDRLALHRYRRCRTSRTGTWCDRRQECRGSSGAG